MLKCEVPSKKFLCIDAFLELLWFGRYAPSRPRRTAALWALFNCLPLGLLLFHFVGDVIAHVLHSGHDLFLVLSITLRIYCDRLLSLLEAFLLVSELYGFIRTLEEIFLT